MENKRKKNVAPISDQDKIKDLRIRLKNTTQQRNKIAQKLSLNEIYQERDKENIQKLERQVEGLTKSVTFWKEQTDFWIDLCDFWRKQCGFETQGKKTTEFNPYLRLVK